MHVVVALAIRDHLPHRSACGEIVTLQAAFTVKNRTCVPRSVQSCDIESQNVTVLTSVFIHGDEMG